MGIYERYEEGSWDAYDETILGHITREVSADRGCFLPSPEELEARKADMRWLIEHGFDDEFNHYVMRCDHPSIALVRKLTARHGPREARNLLTPFLPDGIHAP